MDASIHALQEEKTEERWSEGSKDFETENAQSVGIGGQKNISEIISHKETLETSVSIANDENDKEIWKNWFLPLFSIIVVWHY